MILCYIGWIKVYFHVFMISWFHDFMFSWFHVFVLLSLGSISKIFLKFLCLPPQTVCNQLMLSLLSQYHTVFYRLNKSIKVYFHVFMISFFSWFHVLMISCFYDFMIFFHFSISYLIISILEWLPYHNFMCLG